MILLLSSCSCSSFSFPQYIHYLTVLNSSSGSFSSTRLFLNCNAQAAHTSSTSVSMSQLDRQKIGASSLDYTAYATSSARGARPSSGGRTPKPTNRARSTRKENSLSRRYTFTWRRATAIRSTYQRGRSVIAGGYGL